MHLRLLTWTPALACTHRLPWHVLHVPVQLLIAGPWCLVPVGMFWNQCGMLVGNTAYEVVGTKEIEPGTILVEVRATDSKGEDAGREWGLLFTLI